MTDNSDDDRDPLAEAQAIAGAAPESRTPSGPDSDATPAAGPDVAESEGGYDCAGCDQAVPEEGIEYVINHPRGHEASPVCSLNCAREAMSTRDALRKYEGGAELE